MFAVELAGEFPPEKPKKKPVYFCQPETNGCSVGGERGGKRRRVLTLRLFRRLPSVGSSPRGGSGGIVYKTTGQETTRKMETTGWFGLMCSGHGQQAESSSRAGEAPDS